MEMLRFSLDATPIVPDSERVTVPTVISAPPLMVSGSAVENDAELLLSVVLALALRVAMSLVVSTPVTVRPGNCFRR